MHHGQYLAINVCAPNRTFCKSLQHVLFYSGNKNVSNYHCFDRNSSIFDIMTKVHLGSVEHQNVKTSKTKNAYLPVVPPKIYPSTFEGSHNWEWTEMPENPSRMQRLSDILKAVVEAKSNESDWNRKIQSFFNQSDLIFSTNCGFYQHGFLFRYRTHEWWCM